VLLAGAAVALVVVRAGGVRGVHDLGDVQALIGLGGTSGASPRRDTSALSRDLDAARTAASVARPRPPVPPASAASSTLSVGTLAPVRPPVATPTTPTIAPAASTPVAADSAGTPASDPPRAAVRTITAEPDAAPPTFWSARSRVRSVAFVGLGGGNWELRMQVDREIATRGLRNAIACRLRPGEPEERPVTIPIAFDAGESTGEFSGRFHVARPWAAGRYPVSCRALYPGGELPAWAGHMTVR
jgi:hypothetical protein